MRTYHLSNSVEAFAVELECLFEQNLVLDGPLIRERCEVCQIQHCPFEVVFVPEEHSQCLLAVVSVFFFGHRYVLFHCGDLEQSNHHQINDVYNIR